MKSAVAVLFLLFVHPIIGKDKAPLPDALVRARSAYLLNNTGSQGSFDRLYAELKKWGRWEIVDAPEKSDIVATLSYDDTAVPYGSVYQGTGTIGIIPILSVNLHIVQTGSAIPLWAQKKHSGIYRSRTTGNLVKDLRKRLERK